MRERERERERERRHKQFYIGSSHKIGVIQTPCTFMGFHYNLTYYNCSRNLSRLLYAQAHLQETSFAQGHYQETSNAQGQLQETSFAQAFKKKTSYTQRDSLRYFCCSRFHLETCISQTQLNETSGAQSQPIETLMLKVSPRELYAQD